MKVDLHAAVEDCCTEHSVEASLRPQGLVKGDPFQVPLPEGLAKAADAKE